MAWSQVSGASLSGMKFHEQAAAPNEPRNAPTKPSQDLAGADVQDHLVF